MENPLFPGLLESVIVPDRRKGRQVLTPIALAELRLAEALEALYAAREDPSMLLTHPVADPRRLALAITKVEEGALWMGAARAHGSIPDALRPS